MDKQIWFKEDDHRRIKVLSARLGVSMRKLVMDAISFLEEGFEK